MVANQQLPHNEKRSPISALGIVQASANDGCATADKVHARAQLVGSAVLPNSFNSDANQWLERMQTCVELQLTVIQDFSQKLYNL
jgi:hypothetical protein